MILAARRAGFATGTIRTRAFRHTYATMRHQTLDAGRPVGWKTVADELGHTSWRMIEERYARHRPLVRLQGDGMAFEMRDYATVYAAWEPGRRAAVASDLRRHLDGVLGTPVFAPATEGFGTTPPAILAPHPLTVKG